MKKLSCEIGDMYGKWVVIDNKPITKSGHTYITVKCECGVEELKCLSDLLIHKSTGCRSCKARERSIKILIGDKYKHWTVISKPKLSKYNSILWNVECDCKRYRRWMQGNELTNLNRCFECYMCAAEKRGDIQSKNNGKVGDLKLTRYTKLKTSAKKRDIEFNISIEYLWNLFIQQEQRCNVTGDYIISIDKASLDRIDSTIGYIEGNVQWTTNQANISKHLMTVEELCEFCNKVLNYNKYKKS